MKNVRVVDVTERDRLELFEGDVEIGLLQYQRVKNLLVIEHTEVDSRHRGKGYASHLVREAFDQAQAEGRRVIVVCPFAKAWLLRHPEYKDLDYTHA